MAINSLSIPGYSPPQALDFSPLAQLPQVFRKAQHDAWTLANLDRFGGGRELTPAIREYHLARNQGFTGSFLDYITARRGSVKSDAGALHSASLRGGAQP